MTHYDFLFYLIHNDDSYSKSVWDKDVSCTMKDSSLISNIIRSSLKMQHITFHIVYSMRDAVECTYAE